MLNILKFSSSTIIIFLIRIYQRIKPFFDQVILSVFGYASGCKHSPSCSEYTVIQIRKHGTITGLKKGLQQLARCH